MSYSSYRRSTSIAITVTLVIVILMTSLLIHHNHESDLKAATVTYGSESQSLLGDEIPTTVNVAEMPAQVTTFTGTDIIHHQIERLNASIQQLRAESRQPAMDSISDLSNRINSILDTTKHQREAIRTLRQQLEALQRNVSGGQSDMQKVKYYKQGKDVRYAPLTGCQRPELITEGYGGNSCWRYTTGNGISEVACIARVITIGIHKCGTSDIYKWLLGHSSAYATGIEYYSEFENEKCPTDLFTSVKFSKQTPRYVSAASEGKTIFNGCAGCFSRTKIIESADHEVVIQSAAQYLEFFRTDKTRYIYTLRNPTERFISHYFYSHQIKQLKGPGYDNKTPEEIGNQVLHERVSETVGVLRACLDRHGTTSCILTREYKDDLIFPNAMLGAMLQFGCYAVYLEEIFKFLPKSQVYVSMLEEYSRDQRAATAALYTFIDLSTQAVQDNPYTSSLGARIRNKNSSKKPVLHKTLAMLDEFYKPCNQHMADLMSDNKWLYVRR